MNVEEAVEELLDNNLDLGTRIDLAMEFSSYDDPIIEDALMKIACDCSSEESLLDSCGESLGEIWARQGELPAKKLIKLKPIAKSIAKATFNVLGGKHKNGSNV